VCFFDTVSQSIVRPRHKKQKNSIMSASPDELQTQRSLDNWLPEIPVEPLSARYEVLGDPIGRGGFGVVYRAKKLQLPQHVAVKRLRTADGKAPSLSEQQRFVREVTLAASLKHPNIVSIEAWGRDQDGLYVVMDLVEGGSLQALVENSGPVPVSRLLRYARQICLALQKAHKSGILHRDLKPANVLLDLEGNVQLADFGLARSASGDPSALVKSSGVPMYTYAYASPEQMAGEPLDVRSDLFSLGATLYHLVTGKPAFARDFDLEQIPDELQGLLGGLLKNKRDQRLANVQVVLEQLNELQRTRVTSQVPQPIPQRTAKPARPRPAGELSGVPVESAANPRQNAARPATNGRPTRWLGRLVIAAVFVGMCGIALVVLDQGWSSADDQRPVAQVAPQEQPSSPASAPATLQSSPSTESPAAVPEAPATTAVPDIGAKSKPESPAATASNPFLDADPKMDLTAKPSDSPPQPVTRPELMQAPFTPAAAMAAQAAWAAFLKREVQWKDQFGHELRLIPPGEFQMGSDETVEQLEAAGFVLPDDNWREWIKAESPRHRVRITQPFYLGVSSVTRGQFAAFVRATGYRTEAETDGQGGWGYVAATKSGAQKPEFTWKNTGFEQTDEHPVVNVTWHDVQAYVKWLNDSSAKSGNGGRYRLLTEAEYEYACRAGTTTRFFTGDTLESLQGFANVSDESFAKAYPEGDFEEYQKFPFDDGSPFTSPCGRYSSNPFGLSDMLGNVYVWCEDWYDSEYYGSSAVDDPKGTSAGSFRVLRGGSWSYAPVYLRSSGRDNVTPDGRDYGIGCRVLCECG